MQLFGSLESLRRGQAGALMIGMFLTAEGSTSGVIYTRTDELNQLANIALTLIEELPDQVQWIATPFLDYSNAII